jgi:hypothetical protein
MKYQKGPSGSSTCTYNILSLLLSVRDLQLVLLTYYLNNVHHFISSS